MAADLDRGIDEILDDLAADKLPSMAEVTALCVGIVDREIENQRLGDRCDALVVGIRKLGFSVVDTETDDDGGQASLMFVPIEGP